MFHFCTIEKDENGESPVNRERNKEREERREKRPGEHERNTRQRVRKSECHCRNLRTLTSSWLVPPSSSWSQPSSPLPSSVNIYPSSFSSLSFSLFLALSPARFASNLLLHLSFSNSSFLPSRDTHSSLSLSPPSLLASFVFPPREFEVFCDNSRAAKYSSTDIQNATIGQCNTNMIAISIGKVKRLVVNL